MHPVWMHLAVKTGFTYEELNQANAFWIPNKNKQKPKQTNKTKKSPTLCSNAFWSACWKSHFCVCLSKAGYPKHLLACWRVRVPVSPRSPTHLHKAGSWYLWSIDAPNSSAKSHSPYSHLFCKRQSKAAGLRFTSASMRPGFSEQKAPLKILVHFLWD